MLVASASYPISSRKRAQAVCGCQQFGGSRACWVGTDLSGRCVASCERPPRAPAPGPRSQPAKCTAPKQQECRQRLNEIMVRDVRRHHVCLWREERLPLSWLKSAIFTHAVSLIRQIGARRRPEGPTQHGTHLQGWIGGTCREIAAVSSDGYGRHCVAGVG